MGEQSLSMECPFAGNRGASVPSHPIPESSPRKAPGAPRAFLAPRGFLQEILHPKLVQSSPGPSGIEGGISLPWNCCLWSDGSGGVGMSKTKEWHPKENRSPHHSFLPFLPFPSKLGIIPIVGPFACAMPIRWINRDPWQLEL